MLKDLLARFKRVFTVAEWKQEAQDAMMRKEFVVASLDELHRVERAAAESGQERSMSQQQSRPYQPTNADPKRRPPRGVNYEAENKKANMSLADLMNAIRQQQNVE